MDSINLADTFDLIQEYWSPKIVGELNGQYVKLAKLRGEFIWHHHEDEDELFLVVKGRLIIKLRDQDVAIYQKLTPKSVIPNSSNTIIPNSPNTVILNLFQDLYYYKFLLEFN